MARRSAAMTCSRSRFFVAAHTFCAASVALTASLIFSKTPVRFVEAAEIVATRA